MMQSDSSPKPVPRARLVPGLSLRAGDVLNGRFRVESVAREERSVVTFVAHDITKRSRVGVDVLRIVAGEGIDAVRRAFLAGARSATPLEGAHVARVLDGGVTSDGLPWAAREEAPPRSLASVLAEQHSLSTSQAVDIALAICEALAEAHAHDVLHGALDARSIHLVWTSDGPSSVKVVDLGTASAVAQLELSMLRAPEQLEKDAAFDERADVWGLGVLLYTMLAGAPPFAAESPSTVNLAVALDEPACLAGVEDDLAELVESCLAKNPALRPPNLIVVAEKLAKFGTKTDEILERIRLHDTAPTLLVKKEDYKALAAEKKDLAVTKECEVVAASSSLDIVVEVEKPVRDVTALLPKRPPSVPPVMISVRPEPKPLDVPWKPIVLAAAAACLALAGFLALRPHHAPAPIAAAPPPAEPAPMDLAAAVTATMAPTNANALPDAPQPKKAAAAPATKPAAHHSAPRASAAPPPAPPSHDPEPVTTTSKPEPKADDDLRKFLDDRR